MTMEEKRKGSKSRLMKNKTPIPHYMEKKKRKMGKSGSSSKLLGSKAGKIRSRSNNTKRRLNKFSSKDASFSKKRTSSTTNR